MLGAHQLDEIQWSDQWKIHMSTFMVLFVSERNMFRESEQQRLSNHQQAFSEGSPC